MAPLDALLWMAPGRWLTPPASVAILKLFVCPVHRLGILASLSDAIRLWAALAQAFASRDEPAVVMRDKPAPVSAGAS